VTITFVAWMQQDLLEKGIESAVALAYRPIEILVADNSPQIRFINGWNTLTPW
jgi:hypothetical protein